jgi:hypothetical protein
VVVDIPVSEGLQLPSIKTTIHYDQVFADVQLGTGSGATFGGAPELVFEDVTLELGQLVTGFIGPLVDQVSDVTKPLAPIVSVLTDDIQLLQQLGAKATSLLDIASVVLGPTKFASAANAIKAIADAVAFVDAVDEFNQSGAEGIEINFGTFRLGGNGDPEPAPLNDTTLDPSRDIDDSDATDDQKQKSKGVLDKIGTTKGSFQFPLLTDPLAAVGLLTGKDANLFTYDLPALNLDFNYVKSFPIFPG